MLMLEPSSGAETETFPSRTEKQKKNLILDKLLLPQSSEASGKITFFNIFLNSIRSHNPDCTCFLPHRIMAAKKKASGFMTELLSMRWLQFNPAILRWNVADWVRDVKCYKVVYSAKCQLILLNTFFFNSTVDICKLLTMTYYQKLTPCDNLNDNFLIAFDRIFNKIYLQFPINFPAEHLSLEFLVKIFLREFHVI